MTTQPLEVPPGAAVHLSGESLLHRLQEELSGIAGDVLWVSTLASGCSSALPESARADLHEQVTVLDGIARSLRRVIADLAPLS